MSSLSLDGLAGRLVTLGLLHGVWIGLLAAGVAAIGLRVMPARWRVVQHGMLLGLLGVVAVGPMAMTTAQRWGVETCGPVRDVAIRVAAVQDRPANGTEPAVDARSLRPIAAATVSIGANLAEAAEAFEAIQPVVLGVWLVGAVPLLLRVGLGLGVGSVRRRGARPAPTTIQARCEVLARRMGLRGRVPRVQVDRRVLEPCLGGLIRPYVLLPAGWLDGAGADRIDAVLAHELAHARRWDLPVIVVQRVIEAVWWFHPAVWWLSRSLEHRRERCADALAARATGNRLALADALESVARWRLGGEGLRRVEVMPLGAWLGGEEGSLMDRIREVLGMKPEKARLRWWALAAIPAAVLLGLLVMSSGLARSRQTPAGLEGAGVSGRTVEITGDPIEDSSDRSQQIAYGVQFVQVTEGTWLRSVEGASRVVDPGSGDLMWVLDEAAQRNLKASVCARPESNIVRLPKPTTVDGATVNIDFTQKVPYVKSLNPAATPAGGLAFTPTVANFEDGIRVALSGRHREGATELEADLHRMELQGFDPFLVPAEANGVAIRGTIQLPRFTKADRRVRCTVPEGSAVLVSLGCRVDRVPLPRIGQIAVNVLGELGIDLQPKGRRIEQLVLIRPVPIVLEDGVPVIQRVAGLEAF
jgi:hypothetical protein